MIKKLNIGDVFQIGKNQFHRVLMVDSIYFYYEARDFAGWNKTNTLNSRLTFYGTGVNAFLARHPTFIGNEPFTQHEIDIIRPDLSLSIGRSNKCEWRDLPSMKKNEFENLFGLALNDIINCPKLYIYPKGPKGGVLKEELILPDNKLSFTLKELITKAALVQSKNNQSITGGIGLFRAGVRSKCPTYYIDDYYFGESGIYKRDEEGFDWERYFKLDRERTPFFTFEKVDSIGKYKVIFDLKQVLIGRDIFAVKSVITGKLVIQFQIQDKMISFDLNGMSPGTFYLGLVDENNIFHTHYSITHGYF